MKKIILFIIITILITIYFLYNINEIKNDFLDDSNIINEIDTSKNNKNNKKDEIIIFNDNTCINNKLINKLLFIYIIIKKYSIKTHEKLSIYMVNNLYKNQKFFDYYCINEINEDLKEELDKKILYNNVDKDINKTLYIEKIENFLEILDVNKYIKDILDLQDDKDNQDNKDNMKILNNFIKNKPENLFNLDKITDEIIDNFFKNNDSNLFESNFINDKLILNKFIVINYDNNPLINLFDICNLFLIIINSYYFNKPILIHIDSNINFESEYIENNFNYLLGEIDDNYGMCIKDNNNFEMKINSFLSNFKLYYNTNTNTNTNNIEKIKRD